MKNCAASVVAFRNDQIQLAWFGGLSGVQARLAVLGSQALAQGDEDLKFISHFIAHESTGLEESEDFLLAVEGMTFTFGAQTSTSGRLWKTPPYPDYNWTIRGDADARFGDGFTKKVKAALIGMTDPDLLASFPRKAFVAASNGDYGPILDVGQKLDLLD